MRWDFKGIQDQVKSRISISGSFTAAQTTLIKDLINSSLESIAINFPIEELKKPDYFIQTIADYTTGTVAIVTITKTVTGTTTVWTKDMIGRKIRFEDEIDYYTITDVDASAQTITLDRNYLGDTLTAGEYTIFENSYDLPSDFNWAKLVAIFQSPRRPLDYKPWDYIEEMDIALTNTGTPDYYSYIGKRRIEGDSFTADTGTSTTSVVGISTLSSTDDYYKGYILKNQTRGMTSKVTAYNGTSKTLTIDNAITAQAAGDTISLQEDSRQITFYRRPSEAYNILIKYYMKHPTMYNDYDIPYVPQEFKEFIVNYVLEKYYANDPLSEKYAADKNKELKDLRSKYAKKVETTQREGMFVKTGREFTYLVKEP